MLNVRARKPLREGGAPYGGGGLTTIDQKIFDAETSIMVYIVDVNLFKRRLVKKRGKS